MGACGKIEWEFTAPSLFACGCMRSISLWKGNKLSPAVTFLMLISPLGETEGNNHKMGGSQNTPVFWIKVETRFAPELMAMVQVISKSLYLSWLISHPSVWAFFFQSLMGFFFYLCTPVVSKTKPERCSNACQSYCFFMTKSWPNPSHITGDFSDLVLKHNRFSGSEKG